LKQQNNDIEKLFKEKLQNFEVTPRVNAWANVKAGISGGAAGSAAASASASWSSSVIVGVIIASVAVGGYFFFNNEGEKKISPPQQTPVENVVTKKAEPEVSSDLSEIKSKTANRSVDSESVKKTSTEIANQLSPNEKGGFNSNGVKATTDNSELTEEEQQIHEQTIDEIIAEHQRFAVEQQEIEELAEKLSENNKTASSASAEERDKSTNDPENKVNSNVNSTVNVNEQNRLENKRIAAQVIFPNIVTPDLDGTNDVFKLIKEKSIAIDHIRIDVLTLNGKVIGTSNGTSDGWDGRLPNGSLAPEGPYSYQAIIYIGEKQFSKVGGFVLKR
jgi:gliding motility-associated-like protein